MPILTPDQITIEKRIDHTDYEPYNLRYDYTITTPTTAGDAMLLFRSPSEFVTGFRDKMKALGLNEKGIVAHINEFYPNGRGLDEQTSEHMRRGVGSAVLCRLIQDAVKNSADIVYFFSTKSLSADIPYKKRIH